MHRRQVHAQIGVALVGAHHHGAGFSNGEIHARNGHLSGQELGPQVLAGGFGEALGVVFTFFGAQVRVERVAHVLLFQVDGGQHNVAGRLVPELNNPLAQIGVHHLHAVLHQIWVQVALLGEHRLALDDARGALLPDDAEDNGVVLRRIGGPVHVHAVGLRGGLKFPQIPVEPAQGVVFDLGG